MADVTSRILGVESGGNAYARNPRSSAGGAGQFLDSTWLATLQKHRPDLVAGKSRAELLQLKFDPNLSREMTDAYSRDNQSYLSARGVPINPGTTYLAHFAGPAGASKLFANPTASAESALGSAAVQANPFLRGMTAQNVIDWAARKMDPSKMTPAQMQAASVKKRYATGTSTEGGATGVPTLSGGDATDRLKKALYDQSMIDSGKSLQEQGLKIATGGTKLGAYGGALMAALGGALEGYEGSKKKEAEAEFADAISRAGDGSALMNALLGSPDPKMREAGIELKAKMLAPKASEWTPVADGTAVINKATGEVRSTGLSKPASLPDDVQKYQFDMQQRKAAGQAEIPYADWRKASNAEAAFSKNVIWGVGPDGQPALLQPGTTGEAVATKLPEGYSVAKEPIKLDAGTKWVLLDPQTRQPVGEIPKNLAEAETQKEVGKGEGERRVEAPRVRASLDSSLSGLDRLASEANAVKTSAGLEGATGLSSYLPTLPGGETATTEARLQTLKSQVAFSVLQAMRDASKSGGALGAVSEKELGLLENNLAGLAPEQSAEAFKAALDRIIAYTSDAKERLLRSYRDTYGVDYVQGGEAKAAHPQGPQPQAPSTNSSGFKVLRVR